MREQSERSLLEFVKFGWHFLEPEQRRFVTGWHLEAFCEHLTACSNGQITRLLINCPPGAMKSLLTEVFWPAWEWGPQNQPHLRYVTASYNEGLTVRDNLRFLQLISRPEYNELWGDRFAVDRTGEHKVTNDRTGWKIATSSGGLGTGERGDRVVIDDPHNVKMAESDADRADKLHWFREVMPSRVNDPKTSVIIVIMQRVHEDDIAGYIIRELQGEYVHLMIPMHYDPGRHCVTKIGWSDPREVEGDLYWPERFPPEVVERDQFVMGPYAVAAQYEQSPAPRGGGILKRDWWNLWPPRGADEELRTRFPPMDFMLASLDPAMGEKHENDESGLTIWGTWRAMPSHTTQLALPDGSILRADEMPLVTLPRLMLAYAWAGRLNFAALVDRVIELCRKHHVDCLLVEAKNNGLSLVQEIIRLTREQEFTVVPRPVPGDKVARANAIVPVFTGGLVYAPDRSWADKVISQCEVFPKGMHDDLVDSTTQALHYLREIGLARFAAEVEIDEQRQLMFRSRSDRPPPYLV